MEDTKLKKSDSYCISQLQPFSHHTLALHACACVRACAFKWTRSLSLRTILKSAKPTKPDGKASGKAKAKAKGKAAPRSKAKRSVDDEDADETAERPTKERKSSRK